MFDHETKEEKRKRMYGTIDGGKIEMCFAHCSQKQEMRYIFDGQDVRKGENNTRINPLGIMSSNNLLL